MGISSSSSPSRVMEPVTLALGWVSRMMERAVMLLPQPDSPTMPRVSPLRISKLMPWRMSRVAVSVSIWTCRSRTCRAMLSFIAPPPSLHFRVQQIPQAVAQDADAQDRDHDGKARIDGLVGVGDHKVLGHAEDAAPGCGIGIHAHAQKAQ